MWLIVTYFMMWTVKFPDLIYDLSRDSHLHTGQQLNAEPQVRVEGVSLV